jgi:protein SCO1
MAIKSRTGSFTAPWTAWCPGVIALAIGAFAAQAQTTDQLKREVSQVGVTERLGAAVPQGATFTEAEGGKVTLAGLGGQPLLLSFNYTSCPRLCGLQLSGLARALHEAGYTGEGFALATISIDPAEKLPQLAAYKAGKVREAGGGASLGQAWHFLTGTKGDVDALAASVGFRYRYNPKTGEYAHQATLVVLTGDGHVSGYLHGISFPQASLSAALERARANRVATAAEQKSLGGYLLACMGFDPADPTPLALKLMRAGGLVALAFLLVLLGSLGRRGRPGAAGARPP